MTNLSYFYLTYKMELFCSKQFLDNLSNIISFQKKFVRFLRMWKAISRGPFIVKKGLFGGPPARPCFGISLNLLVKIICSLPADWPASTHTIKCLFPLACVIQGLSSSVCATLLKLTDAPNKFLQHKRKTFILADVCVQPQHAAEG